MPDSPSRAARTSPRLAWSSIRRWRAATRRQAAEKGPSASLARSLLAQRGSLTLALTSGFARLASGSARQAEYASLVASLAASQLDLFERPAGFNTLNVEPQKPRAAPSARGSDPPVKPPASASIQTHWAWPKRSSQSLPTLTLCPRVASSRAISAGYRPSMLSARD